MTPSGSNHHRWDESDVRVRPNPRGNRPRTKERPTHDDAVQGRVLTIDRGRFTVLVGGPLGGSVAGSGGVLAEGAGAGTGRGTGRASTVTSGDERVVVAMKARELARSGVRSIAVGDRVDLVGDTTGATDTLARVVRVHERTSVLRRTADDTDPIERVLVANADQLLVVTSTADPAPRLRLVDRCLAAAWDAGMDAAIILTKADLGDPEPVVDAYRALEVPVLVLRRLPGTGDGGGPLVGGLEVVRERLTGRDSVLVGPSGVGKSTLVNALVPTALRATGGVNAVTGRGRHTSSSAVALRLPAGPEALADAAALETGAGVGAAWAGWVTDTPGVRSFGLAHVDPQRLLATFPDLAPGGEECPRGCSHDEPSCALEAFVERGGAGPAGPARLQSLRRLLRSRAGETGDAADH